MKCWFCEKEARGVCIFCGRGICYDHANKDEIVHAKSDTSTGYTSFLKVENALKCSECKVKWESLVGGNKKT